MKQDWTPAERAAAEAKYKAEFSAADLQRYTEEDEVVPFEEVIRALEEKQRLLDEHKK
jgi:FAD/FMN-containing dehydrogenase